VTRDCDRWDGQGYYDWMRREQVNAVTGKRKCANSVLQGQGSGYDFCLSHGISRKILAVKSVA
jgi:hypothetical protein